MTPIDLTRSEAITSQHAVNSTELRWLAEQAQDKEIIVEIGSYLGRSTLALADHCPGRVYAVDPWTWRGGTERTNGHMTHDAKDDVYHEFLRNMEYHILTGKVIPVRQTSQEAFPKFQMVSGENWHLDMVFIDGNHNYRDVRWEIEHYCPLLSVGGLLCGHDYDWPEPGAGQIGVTQAVNELLGSTNIEHCDTIWSYHVNSL